MKPIWLVALLLMLPVAAPGQGLLVDLDAQDFSAGIWENRGTLGSFRAIGMPKRVALNGVEGVALDGKADLFRGPVTSAALEGASARTVEVWAFNPSIDAPEETLISWGRRGGPGGTMFGFNWGHSGAYGAVTHWANDLGWNGVPKAGQWHYLVYTYDGKEVRIYDNTQLKGSRQIDLNTATGTHINLGAPNDSQGEPQRLNEFDHSPLMGSLTLSIIRVRAGALTEEQIAATFDRESPRFGAKAPASTAYLKQGRTEHPAAQLTLSLLNATQTAASLIANASRFDFLPSDRLTTRLDSGFHHLGDFTLRVRTGGGRWIEADSAAERGVLKPVNVAGALAAADVTESLGESFPLQVIREWCVVQGAPVLRFRLTNRTRKPVEIGAFGAAMVFNNLITGRSLEETHDRCAFADPYIGGPSGYLQVTRLNGEGPALVVLPEKGTSFEAYRPLYSDPTPRDVTFEGFYEWMTHTKAYVRPDWNGATPWNAPTSRTLAPGESASYGYRFTLAPAVKQIEETVYRAGLPVAVGVPGYVIGVHETVKLFVRSHSRIASVDATCQEVGAPSNSRKALFHEEHGPLPGSDGWNEIRLSMERPGRFALQIAYEEGRKQFVHYIVTPSEQEQIRNLGKFHAEKQWFTDPTDPFKRTDSFLPYNREARAMVLQHSHTWFSGLSDEIGAGASVAMAMKNLYAPDPHEVALLERYATHTLWGVVQNPDYSVRASVFYYQPDLLPNYPYQVRGGWDKARSETTWRSFNYPHVAAVYWALYRIARNHPGLTGAKPWDWYLDHAYNTVMAIKRHAPGYAEVGLMVGSVFPEIVKDLRREGWTGKAAEIEAYMRQREAHWRTLRYPFGSEMPWDSTGQEEIYTWCRYFGDTEKADVTLKAVLGYMPTVANWAYNGAGRRYFDAPVNGTRWPDIVRMTNHYGSAINSIPVLDAYRRHPDDLYLLRVGYAGMNQIVANIDRDGFASYGFDADPAKLQFDPYTADYGIAFYGYSRNAGAYVLKHPTFGWLGFGCNVQSHAASVVVVPTDGFRKRIYYAPRKLWFTLDAGRFLALSCDETTHTIRLRLAPDTGSLHTARLRVEAFGKAALPTGLQSLQQERGAYLIPLQGAETTLTLRAP